MTSVSPCRMRLHPLERAKIRDWPKPSSLAPAPLLRMRMVMLALHFSAESTSIGGDGGGRGGDGGDGGGDGGDGSDGVVV